MEHKIEDWCQVNLMDKIPVEVRKRAKELGLVDEEDVKGLFENVHSVDHMDEDRLGYMYLVGVEIVKAIGERLDKGEKERLDKLLEQSDSFEKEIEAIERAFVSYRE